MLTLLKTVEVDVALETEGVKGGGVFRIRSFSVDIVSHLKKKKKKKKSLCCLVAKG